MENYSSVEKNNFPSTNLFSRDSNVFFTPLNSDQLHTLKDITNNVFFERDGKSRSSRRQNEIARERWGMLAKILLKQQRISWRPDEVRNCSVRRFNSFQLIKSTRTEKSLGSPGGWWLECSVEIAGNTCHIEIHHLEQTLTPKELAGFNNTGNICVWPSEEVLTYYLLSNLQLFEGKLVLEVGGGMTCLAGLFLASYGNVKRVDLTDGNRKSVDNVQRIIKRNKLEPSKVRSFHLDWVDRRQVTEPYDIVLSSDCLFFDETRVNLVDTIWELLKEDGMALVIAPRRGDTLNSFIKIAYKKGFNCLLKNRYDETIWQKHLSFKDSHMEYDEDLHYPVLLILNKAKCSCPAFSY